MTLASPHQRLRRVMSAEWLVLTVFVALPVAVAGVFLFAPRPSRLGWFELHWPRELPPEIGASVLRQIAADRRAGVVVLEAEASKGLVCYRLWVRAEAAERLTGLLISLVPEMAVTPASERPS